MSNADDESAILKQASEAARLIDSGLSVSRAAAEVGLKRPTLYYYLGKLRKGEGVKPVKGAKSVSITGDKPVKAKSVKPVKSAKSVTDDVVRAVKSKSVKHIRGLKPVSSASVKPVKDKKSISSDSVKPVKCAKSASIAGVKPVKGAKSVSGAGVKHAKSKSVKPEKCKKPASRGSAKPAKGKVVKPVRGAKSVVSGDVKGKSVKPVNEQKQHGQNQSYFLSSPQSRSAEGKFLPGISGNPGGQRKITAEARGIFEDFTPTVAREITKIFTELCEDEDKDYKLILTYAKEILDRGLGKPKQAVDLVDTTSEDEEYEFLQEHLLGDVEALRLAAALAHHLEVKSSIDGRAPEPGAVENVPPPPGAGPDPGPGCEWKDLAEDNNLDASSIG